MSIFGTVREKKFPRSTKNLSHSTIFDCGFGRLIPTNFEEISSNARYVFQHSNFIQPVSLPAPAFTKIRVRQRTFAVPLHILYGYSYLEKFMSDDTGELLEPYTTMDDLSKTTYPDYWNPDANIPVLSNGELCDFMNIPTCELTLAGTLKFTAPFKDKKVSIIKAMSYLKVWNDWYRDENYQPDLEPVLEQIKNLSTFPYVAITDVFDNTDYPELDAIPLLEYLFTPRMANVGKDYFMGVLPTQQQGDPVSLPVGDTAPVFGNNLNDSWSGSTGMYDLQVSVGDSTDTSFGNTTSDHTYDNVFAADFGGEVPDGVNLYADLRKAAGIDIVQFRTLQAAQQWKERNARGGRRLPEILRSRFGSRVPDAFIPRSIYVGGTVEDVKIDTIFATTKADNQNLGDYAGRAYSAGSSRYFGYASPLPTMMITIQTILPVPQYWQGIRKDNTRLSNFDKIQPEFAHIGEQPVMSDEFYVNLFYNSGYNKDAIFGYVPRYADWMVHLDEIHGSFRGGQLASWHTGLILPPLDDDNNIVENLEQTPQLLTQNYFKDANRIFNYSPTVECMAKPFRCVVQFDARVTTTLPKHPRSY